MATGLRVLIIEDSEDDAMLLIRHLQKEVAVADTRRLETEKELRQIYSEKDWDVIICDYVLPKFSALKALEIIKSLDADTPFIVVSGRVGEEAAVNTMKAGAHDYITKDNLSRLVPAIQREIREMKIRRKGKKERARLEKEIIETSAREQRRIGHDLHDNLGQLLTGLAFRCKVLSSKLEKKNLPEAEECDQILELINESISQTRELARGLTPVGVDKNTLGFALRKMAEQFKKIYEIDCEFHGDQSCNLADEETSAQLYYLAREAVNNAAKHSKGTKIDVYLSRQPNRLILTVHDNGEGLEPGTLNNQGLGLQIMRYRAKLIGAELSISRADNQGTKVECRLDIK